MIHISENMQNIMKQHHSDRLEFVLRIFNGVCRGHNEHITIVIITITFNYRITDQPKIMI